MNLGIKAALKNLNEVVSKHAPNAVWATEDAKKQVFDAISLASASLTVSAVRASKKAQKAAPTGTVPTTVTATPPKVSAVGSPLG